MNSETDKTPAAGGSVANAKAEFNLASSKLERTKLALEIRLKRRELQNHGHQRWRDLLANPLALAVVGGTLTLLSSVLTNFLSATASREADERKATYAREAEARSLQSELIKSFLKATGSTKEARDSLVFLVEAGLIPDHEPRIRKYLGEKSSTVPFLGERQQFKHVPEDQEVASRISRLLVAIEKLADKSDSNKLSAGSSPDAIHKLLRDFATKPGFESLSAEYADKSTSTLIIKIKSGVSDGRETAKLDNVLKHLSGIDAWIDMQLKAPPNPKAVAGSIIQDFVAPRWSVLNFYYLDCVPQFPFC